MAAKDFTFISPGVFTNEVDQSQYGGGPPEVGPAIIGRFEKGPGMVPTQINSREDLIKVFGENSQGTGENSWRDGNKSAVNYGGWAAEAWLRNNSPVTIIRLLGQEGTQQATNNTGVQSGWKNEFNTGSNENYTHNGGAFGLFVIPSGSNAGALVPLQAHWLLYGILMVLVASLFLGLH